MGVHSRRPGELTFKLIGPLVIGAHQPSSVAAAFGQKSSSVAADIGHNAHLAVVAPDGDEGLIAELKSHVIPGLGHLLEAADAKPFLAEEMFALEVEDPWIGVVSSRHRPRFVIAEPVALPERLMYLCESAFHHLASPFCR